MTDNLFGSDLVVHRLAALGCTHMAINPGATLRGLQDSVERPGSGIKPILALHEEIAVAMAHGFFKAAGRPMAVGLHDTVGLLHSSMALFNAWADRAALLAVVGTGPLDSDQRRPWIDWVHTLTDQGEPVRNFTVYNDQPNSVAAALSSVGRGWRRAVQQPAGPSLVSLDVLIQEERAKFPSDGGLGLSPQPPRIGPDPRTIERSAELLRQADSPLFVTDRPLTVDASEALVSLSEKLGAGLVELGGGASFPVNHANDLSETRPEAIARADLIVFVDVRDPAWALNRGTAHERRPAFAGLDAAFVTIGVAPLMARQNMVTEAGFSSDHLEIISEPELALSALDDMFPVANQTLGRRLGDLRDRQEMKIPESRGGRVHPGRLGLILREELDNRDWIVSYGDLGGWARRTLRFTHPGQYLGRSGGEGLGYGLGASVGAAIAEQGSGRIVIDLQGDGDLLYTPQALWTAARENVGLLVVVDGNNKYYRDEIHGDAIATQRGRRPSAELTSLDKPRIDFVGLARSLGMEAFGPAADDSSTRQHLRKALDSAAAGEPVLVDVHTLTP